MDYILLFFERISFIRRLKNAAFMNDVMPRQCGRHLVAFLTHRVTPSLSQNPLTDGRAILGTCSGLNAISGMLPV